MELDTSYRGISVQMSVTDVIIIPKIFKREISVRWNVLTCCGGTTFSAELRKTCPYSNRKISHTQTPENTVIIR